MSATTGHIDTVVVGGGQAGLSVGYHLAQKGRQFVILEGAPRVGDQWRNRWDSLRLFTPARFDGLAGMPFPSDPDYFPTKDEMADYLEAYVDRFHLPVRTSQRVEGLTRDGDTFTVRTSAGTITANNVVVAMGHYQTPRVPAFAADLGAAITQLHSKEYRSPAQLQEGPVLLVGAGNSAAEIGMEVSRTHQTYMSGRDVGHIPFRISGFLGRKLLVRLVLRGLFHRVLTVGTPMGRKMRPRALSRGGPLIRTKPKELAAAGVTRVPRVAGVKDGRPVLDNGEIIDVANIIWCTGFNSGLEWIDLPIHGDHEPLHDRGIVASEPGLYFVGLHFQSALSSGMIHGVGRDAANIVRHLTARTAGGAVGAQPLAGTVAAWLPQRISS